MTEREQKFPVLFGDGRTRSVTPDFLINSWPALWDSFVGLIGNLEEYNRESRLNEQGEELLRDCYEFLEKHPELKIEDTVTLKRWGDELGWPDWFKKATRVDRDIL